MCAKFKNKSATNLIGSIAAAQTLVEQYPLLITKNEKGFTCSFDLLTTLFSLVSDEPLEDVLVRKLTENLGDINDSWLGYIEDTVKLEIETNLTNLLTCEINPLIPDKLIGGGTFLDGGEYSLPFNSEGIIIPVSSLDFTGVLENCPVDPDNAAARAQYMTCYTSDTAKSDNPKLLDVQDLWKHDDFNAFLWYVKNKGFYSNVQERQKLMWDNRYKTKPYQKYERKPETFFTKKKGFLENLEFNGADGVVPFDREYLKAYNAFTDNKATSTQESENLRDKVYKKKQILECSYIEGDGQKSGSFRFRLAASNYYKTRKIKSKTTNFSIKFNKTIFEFNHDFLMSLKLFDARTYLTQIVSNLFGNGNFSVNIGVKVDIDKNQDIIDELINQAINKVIISSDNEINDCFFTFSNEEYEEALKRSNKKKQNTFLTQEIVSSYLTQLEDYDKINTSAKESEGTKTIIQNVLTGLANEVIENQDKDEKNSNISIGVNYDAQFELVRMIAYPLVKPLFSPKVLTLILINTYVMGNPLELGKKTITFEGVTPFLTNILVSVIKQVKDIIIEMLYSFVIEKLIPLLSAFSLRLVLEQLESYRRLMEEMLTACSNCRFSFANTGIDNVDYVDIDPKLEELKQTPISNSNC